MKRIVFICPYFGKLPSTQMDLWLQSCSMNPTINWLIFTDDYTKYNYPKNVSVKYMTLEELKNKIQKKFDFPIFLDNAYKLCDYKPTYGYIFSEFIKEYDYWGHCDMSDCIFGDIRKYITDSVLKKYDKIGFLGHLTLYKNNDNVNKRFMLGTKSGISFQDVLSSKNNMAFDELNEYSINTIYNENSFKLCRIDDYYYDISPLSYPFKRSVYDKNYCHNYLKKVPTIFEWNNGKLYKLSVINNSIKKEELLYVHFQKRKMARRFKDIKQTYYIIPNEFTTKADVSNIRYIKKVSKYKLYPQFFKLKIKSLKYRISKMIGD